MIAEPNVTPPHSKYGQALGEEFAFKTAVARDARPYRMRRV